MPLSQGQMLAGPDRPIAWLWVALEVGISLEHLKQKLLGTASGPSPWELLKGCVGLVIVLHSNTAPRCARGSE